MLRARKNKLFEKKADLLSLKKTKKIKVQRYEPVTMLKFIISVLWGTVSVLTFTLIIVSFGFIVFLGQFEKKIIRNVPLGESEVYGKIIYNNDKPSYYIDEEINLDITNNSSESIYLAPCEYFNKFEKKISDKWQSLSLADCNEEQNATDAASIEKITKKAKETILAKKLGEGIWRGVSVVYFGCQKAQSESCKNNKKIYTNEFTISGVEEMKNSASTERINLNSQNLHIENELEIASCSAPQHL